MKPHSFLKTIFLSIFFCINFFTYAKEVLTEFEHRDLQLFDTYQQKPGLIASINRTQTQMGHTFLKEQLANPLVDIDQLQHRQEIINTILIDASLHNALQEKLKEFAHYEQSLTQVANADAIGKNVISNFYFKNSYLRWLNKYPAGLEAGQVLHIANLSAPLIEHAVIHFLLSEKLRGSLGIDACCPAHDHGHKTPCKLNHHHTPAPSARAVFVYNTYNVLHTLIHLAGFKGLIDHMRQQADVIQNMQESLMQVRNCLESAQAIYEELETHTELNEKLTEFHNLNALFTTGKGLSPELQEFLTLINSATFTGEPSYFSRQGVILRAYALAQKVHIELQEKLSAIAAIDFYRSAAQLMREYSNTSTPFTFAKFSKQDTPLLHVKGFWNPLINIMQPIKEEISLGTNAPHIAIVTGPNKAGKSTSLNALCATIVLAQTLSIVPALECHITPFSYIRTGFNMTSRVREGQSLFSASLDFAHELINYTESHQDKFVFIALDELFNSTDFHRGSLIARRFAYALDASRNCVALMATHFAALTELEAENPRCYKNFKAELITENHQSRYILEPGISKSDEVLRLISQDANNEPIRFI